MIRVTVKQGRTDAEGKYINEIIVMEHKEGTKAWVANGVLTIYPENVISMDFGNAIAGYESGSWVGWQKVSDSENNKVHSDTYILKDKRLIRVNDVYEDKLNYRVKVKAISNGIVYFSNYKNSSDCSAWPDHLFLDRFTLVK